MNTEEAIEEIIQYWDKYQNDMRPETRNDFLRVFKEKTEALTHAIEHMKRGQWQDISTAPKDETHILVCGGVCVLDDIDFIKNPHNCSITKYYEYDDSDKGFVLVNTPYHRVEVEGPTPLDALATTTTRKEGLR